ncbi:glutathione S-transferase T2-like [Eutrema salsugineum]|uniref:glutathione S-transferase T2-like n=1 Tax=Eutrema salsugineum TaxID=72664 RepID=UPI000CED2067|nr:glutathione S-transferase T2-like [Eutrema salsugineum]
MAHEIFYNNHKKKFTLEHVWYELRNDQKWYALSTDKVAGNSKKRRVLDGSGAEETQPCDEDNGGKRPAGVKASKAKGKKSAVEKEEPLLALQAVWQIQEKDLEMKAKIKKMGILECLLAKQVPLSDYEEYVKKKLITELF